MKAYPRETPNITAAVGVSADALRAQFPGSAVVVLVGVDLAGHSFFSFASRSACLPVIGLLDVGGKMVRAAMPEEFR